MSALSSGTRTRRRHSWRSHRAAHVVAIVACAIWAFPIYWMLNTSFKTTDHITTTVPQFFPAPFSLGNYIDAFTKAGFFSSLLNSIVVALSVVLVSVAFGFLAAAALSRFHFTGRRAILIAILAVQMIPGTALLIPLFLAFKSLGLLNSYVGLGAAYVATVLPFSIWMLRGFFQGIPPEIEEAARVDGATTFRVLRSIYFPLVLPGLISTSVFAFIAAWNDYITAYVLLKDQAKYTLPVYLVSFSSNLGGTDFGGQIAASVLFAVPVVVFFMLVQRNLVAGMSAGSVKG
ncbi:MAG TPA: carbohydrate ABC transporter permease [Microbacteriaceae bacterium]|jgi:N,N'-diacetylchitobiose transport system permease protein|nr:carbohydrate ABC transporter permease [Microbacteriaceae bacterium]